jgi:hypothetical protein
MTLRLNVMNDHLMDEMPSIPMSRHPSKGRFNEMIPT